MAASCEQALASLTKKKQINMEEITPAPITPRPATTDATPATTAAPQSSEPTLSKAASVPRAPLVIPPRGGVDQIEIKAKTPKSLTPRSRTPRFMTPIGSPVRRALQLTRLDPEDAWLPITESRNGNAYYAAFHTLCSGIGIQALVIPGAFTILGW